MDRRTEEKLSDVQNQQKDRYEPRHRGLGEECTTYYILSEGTRDRTPSPTNPAIAIRSKRNENLETIQKRRPVNDQ